MLNNEAGMGSTATPTGKRSRADSPAHGQEQPDLATLLAENAIANNKILLEKLQNIYNPRFTAIETRVATIENHVEGNSREIEQLRAELSDTRKLSVANAEKLTVASSTASSPVIVR